MPQLILIRHGQSLWNKENKFTGWVDVDLSEQGIQEAKEAAILLKKNNINFTKVFSSKLLRANRTANIILEELGLDIPLTRSWKLNERHYGALQGKNKKEIAEIHGADQVHIWRRSYDTPPPELENIEMDDEETPAIKSESLKDTYIRVLSYWEEVLSHQIKNEKILIAAHGNSLRALMKLLFDISDEEIVKLEIPTGKPILCELDEKLKGVSYRYLD